MEEHIKRIYLSDLIYINLFYIPYSCSRKLDLEGN